MEGIRIVTNNDNKVVTRRNDLLEAKYRLTLQEQRFMLWVLSSISPDDADFQTYRVKIKDLADIIGVNDKDFYARMKATTKKVMGRVIEIHKDGEEHLMPLINRATYNRGKGTVDVRLDELLREYLVQLKDNFTTIRLKYAFQLSSTYALRVYELLVQYRKVGHRRISVEDLRRMLDIADGEYARWSNFDMRVLRPAQAEINTKTDIRFEYEKLKQGRKITHIRFVMQPNADRDDTPTLLPETTSGLVETLIDLGVTRKTALAWARDYSPTRITKAIETLGAARARGQTVGNVGGWLRRALEQGWEDAEILQKRAEEEKRRNREKQEKTRKDAEMAVEAQKEAYWQYRRGAVKSLIGGLTESEEKDLRAELQKIAEAETFLKPKASLFQTPDVWTSPMIFSMGVSLLEQRKGLQLKTREAFLEEDYKEN